LPRWLLFVPRTITLQGLALVMANTIHSLQTFSQANHEKESDLRLGNIGLVQLGTSH
jgi:hypothetical protein